MWMKLPRETKALILHLKSPPESNTKGTRKYILHDISAFEFINNLDGTYPTMQPTNTPNDSNTTLLANIISLHDHTIFPADIRKVLSTTNSNNPKNQNGKPASTSSATVTIDGIKYMQCNTHTTYKVSIHKHKISSSLVDI